VLDIESVRVLKPGKFEIDLVHLFNKKNPLVYKLEEGKYIIDIAETFKRSADSRKRGNSFFHLLDTISTTSPLLRRCSFPQSSLTSHLWPV